MFVDIFISILALVVFLFAGIAALILPIWLIYIGRQLQDIFAIVCGFITGFVIYGWCLAMILDLIFT